MGAKKHSVSISTASSPKPALPPVTVIVSPLSSSYGAPELSPTPVGTHPLSLSLSLRLLVVRHAETSTSAIKPRILCGQSVDEELSLRGHRQASALAHRLFKEPIERIYTSDLKKSVSTAKHVASVLKNAGEPIVDCRLREQNIGTEMAGTSWAAVKRWLHKLGISFEDYLARKCSTDASTAETTSDFARRTIDAYIDVVDRHLLAPHDITIKRTVPNALPSISRPMQSTAQCDSDTRCSRPPRHKCVLLVTHGGVIVRLIKHLIQDLGFKAPPEEHLSRYPRHAAIYEIRLQLKNAKWTGRLARFNCVSHLACLEEPRNVSSFSLLGDATVSTSSTTSLDESKAESLAGRSRISISATGSNSAVSAAAVGPFAAEEAAMNQTRMRKKAKAIMKKRRSLEKARAQLRAKVKAAAYRNAQARATNASGVSENSQVPMSSVLTGRQRRKFDRRQRVRLRRMQLRDAMQEAQNRVEPEPVAESSIQKNSSLPKPPPQQKYGIRSETRNEALKQKKAMSTNVQSRDSKNKSSFIRRDESLDEDENDDDCDTDLIAYARMLAKSESSLGPRSFGSKGNGVGGSQEFGASGNSGSHNSNSGGGKFLISGMYSTMSSSSLANAAASKDQNVRHQQNVPSNSVNAAAANNTKRGRKSLGW